MESLRHWWTYPSAARKEPTLLNRRTSTVGTWALSPTAQTAVSTLQETGAVYYTFLWQSKFVWHIKEQQLQGLAESCQRGRVKDGVGGVCIISSHGKMLKNQDWQ